MADENLLMVEGVNDAHAFVHLLKYYHNVIPDNPKSKENDIRVKINGRPLTVRYYSGIERLKESLEAAVDVSIVERIGVVLDADDNPVGRWESIRNILHNVTQNSERKNVYSSVPLKPAPQGTLIDESGKPRAGVWLMPDNNPAGNLEHFLDQLIPANDPLGVLAEKCVGEAEVVAIQVGKGDQFPDPKKARVYTWLAWQEKPGSQFGVALSKGYFEAGLPLAEQFVAWLGQVFEF